MCYTSLIDVQLTKNSSLQNNSKNCIGEVLGLKFSFSFNRRGTSSKLLSFGRAHSPFDHDKFAFLPFAFAFGFLPFVALPVASSSLSLESLSSVSSSVSISITFSSTSLSIDQSDSSPPSPISLLFPSTGTATGITACTFFSP